MTKLSHSSRLIAALKRNDKVINEFLESCLFVRGDVIIAAGNGGSKCSGSSHLVEELMGKYKTKRPPIWAIDLASNSSNLTVLGNDFGYHNIFARQIEAAGSRNAYDILVLFTTSGNSSNIVNALKKHISLNKKSKNNNICLLISGNSGGKCHKLVSKDPNIKELLIIDDDSAIIQEVQLMVVHLLIERIEKGIL